MFSKQRQFAVALSLFMACFLIAGCASSTDDDSASHVQPKDAQTETKQTKDGDSVTKSQSPMSTSANSGKAKSGMPAMGGMGKMKFPAPKDMKFKDEVESNAKLPQDISDIVFTNKDGSTIELASYIGKKNVVLVFTEGFNGMLCPFCKTQTSRLVANYDKFKERNCEVIVVYPGPSDRLDEFVEAALKTEKEQVDLVPFPIVLDKEFAATDYFDIHSKHAHPSTYLIDKKGGVQFAYVGADMTADRPSVSAIIKKLDELEKN